MTILGLAILLVIYIQCKEQSATWGQIYEQTNK